MDPQGQFHFVCFRQFPDQLLISEGREGLEQEMGNGTFSSARHQLRSNLLPRYLQNCHFHAPKKHTQQERKQNQKFTGQILLQPALLIRINFTKGISKVVKTQTNVQDSSYSTMINPAASDGNPP